METKKILTILVLALGLMVCFAQVSQAAPMGTAITYQGRLMDKNKPADGLYDFQFKLYDSNDPCTGTQLASPIDINDLEVIDGHFVVELDFGSDVFDGNSVWLETRVVRSPMGSDPATLSPLVELTPTPYALYAETAGGDNDWRVSGDNMYAIPSGTVSVSQSHDAAGPGLKVSRGFAPPMLGNTRTEIDATSINAYFTSMGTSGTALKLNDESAGNVVLAEGGGNVGIGTTNPLSKLSVGGDGIANTGVYGSGNTYGVYGSGSTVGVYGRDSDSGSYGRLGYGDYGMYGSGSGVGVEGEDSGEGSHGRLGFATYGVYGFASLHGVYGSGSSVGVWGEDSDSGSSGRLGYGAYGGYFSGDGYFSGKVGIGTPNPGQNLSVWEGMNIDQSNSNDGSISPSLRFGSGSSGEGIASKRTSGGNQYGLDFYTGVANRMSITSSGNVGIGTSSPDDGKLEVNGEISTGHGGLRWKLFEGSSDTLGEIKFSHGLDADKIYSITCVFRDSKSGTGIAQEYQQGSDLLACFSVLFDAKEVTILVGLYYSGSGDRYRCIVWYVDS